jgi:hypothetical protein
VGGVVFGWEGWWGEDCGVRLVLCLGMQDMGWEVIGSGWDFVAGRDHDDGRHSNGV